MNEMDEMKLSEIEIRKVKETYELADGKLNQLIKDYLDAFKNEPAEQSDIIATGLVMLYEMDHLAMSAMFAVAIANLAELKRNGQ